MCYAPYMSAEAILKQKDSVILLLCAGNVTITVLHSPSITSYPQIPYSSPTSPIYGQSGSLATHDRF